MILQLRFMIYKISIIEPKLSKETSAFTGQGESPLSTTPFFPSFPLLFHLLTWRSPCKSPSLSGRWMKEWMGTRRVRLTSCFSSLLTLELRQVASSALPAACMEVTGVCKCVVLQNWHSNPSGSRVSIRTPGNVSEIKFSKMILIIFLALDTWLGHYNPITMLAPSCAYVISTLIQSRLFITQLLIYSQPSTESLLGINLLTQVLSFISTQGKNNHTKMTPLCSMNPGRWSSCLLSASLLLLWLPGSLKNKNLQLENLN